MKTKFFTLLLISFFGSAQAQCFVQAFGQPTGCGTPCTGNVQAFGNGTPPMAYVWQPGNYTTQNVTGLCATTYTVTMTDGAGCIATATATVNQNNGVFAFASCSQAQCNQANGTAAVNATGGTPPYTFSWAPSGQTTQTITGLVAGCYTVTVTDAGGCTVTASCCVTSVGGPAITTTNVNPSNCPNCTGSASAIASGGTMPYTYMWAPSGGNNSNATGLCQGVYTVCVTDANGCTACTNVTINCVVGLNDEPLEADVNLFPNPANDEISISLDQELSDVSIVVYNVVGERISAHKFSFINGKKFRMDIRSLSEGIYFVELRKGNMTIKKKFVKN